MFKQFIILYSIIIIHEFGHVLISQIYNWKIKKICFYPYGGYTIFDGEINKFRKEEIMVLLFGPIFQLIYFFLITILYYNNIISYYTYNIFYNYNNLTLIFNMLPIHPLDGSKLINIIFNTFISFKRSHIILVYISYVFIIISLLIFYSKINLIIIFSILIFHVIKEHKYHKYIFNGFLLNRYLNNKIYKNNNYIKGIKIYNMKKYKNNIFLIDKIQLSESVILNKIFNIKKNV